jgi:uncharacterized SAM-binding protein YcdF (DUF218 family)
MIEAEASGSMRTRRARLNQAVGRRPRQRLRAAIGGALMLLVAQGLWQPWLGGFLIVADPLQHADAIVPLAGERSRIDAAAQLFARGYANWYVITDMKLDGTMPPGTYARSVRRQLAGGEVPAHRLIEAPGSPATTYQEAIGVRELAEAQRWRSLIVVTSPYHTRRSRMIFQQVFRSTGVTVAISPAAGHWYSADSWRRTPVGVQVTLKEYLKLALYHIGCC